MPYCVLKGCVNSSKKTNKDQGITFHRFLPNGHVSREKWIKFVQKNRNEATWLPSEHTCLCSIHFREEDKNITKTGRIYLKKTAMPFDNDLPVTSKISENEATLSAPESDSDIISDIPQIECLKERLSSEMKAKNKLFVKFKKVQRQNRYLKHKCKAYKLLAKSLKERFTLLCSQTEKFGTKTEIKLKMELS